MSNRGNGPHDVALHGHEHAMVFFPRTSQRSTFHESPDPNQPSMQHAYFFHDSGLFRPLQLRQTKLRDIPMEEDQTSADTGFRHADLLPGVHPTDIPRLVSPDALFLLPTICPFQESDAVEDTRRMQGTANRSYTIGNMLYRLRPNPHCTPKIQRHPLFDPLRHIILRAG